VRQTVANVTIYLNPTNVNANQVIKATDELVWILTSALKDYIRALPTQNAETTTAVTIANARKVMPAMDMSALTLTNATEAPMHVRSTQPALIWPAAISARVTAVLREMGIHVTTLTNVYMAMGCASAMLIV
jgi:hypothetical protein